MSSLLDAFIPRPHARERDRVAVVAEVPASWDAIRHLDGRHSRFVRALFALRHLPDLMNGRLTEPGANLTAPTLDDFARPGSDFQFLDDRPGRGFVVGSIARCGQEVADVRAVAPADFALFAEPGFGKIAWGLEVEPRRSGGSWITFELRVALTDAHSEAAFDRASKVVGPFLTAVRTVVLGLLEKQLDAIDPEHTALPGDLLMPARFTRTMGVVIETPPAQVWPWLLEGFVHPEWRDLEVGSLVGTSPGATSPLSVLVLEPGRALVLGSPSLRKPGPRRRSSHEPPDFKLTWALVLEPIGDGACWLGARVRADTAYGLELALQRGWELLGHQVLQRTHLQHVKAHAEQLAA